MTRLRFRCEQLIPQGNVLRVCWDCSQQWMETILSNLNPRLIWGDIGVIEGNGKENGSYFIIIRLYRSSIGIL